MTKLNKTLGQIAYEEDCKRRPYYDVGIKRKAWDELGPIEKWSWEKNPTPREWNKD